MPAVASRAVAWAGVGSPTGALELLRFLEARTGAVEGFELIPEDWMHGIKWFPAEEAIKEVRAHPKISSLSVVKLPPAGEMPVWFG